ncbi:MAG: Type secretion system pilin [Candidatus Parcubacteria bacterium]
MTPSEASSGNDWPGAGERRMQNGPAGRARAVAFFFALLFIGFGANQVLAQSGEIYSPCWSRDECLNLNGGAGSGTSSQPGLGECGNDRCFCPQGASCSDPSRREAACPGGQGKCYSNPPPVPLTVAIGGAARVVDIGDYIARVYNYGVTVAGILAGVMFVIGGFQYLTAGSSGRVSKAKERIKDALVGLLLVLGAYAILNTVNPDVLRLQMPKVPLVKKKLFVACQYFEMQRPCGQTFTLVKNQGVPDTAPMAQQYRVATAGDTGGGATTTSCIGKSCSRAGSDDATKRCRIPPNAPRPTSTNSAPPPASSEACIAAPVAPYQCLDCTPFGGDCQGSGPSSTCCSGFCTGGRLRSMTGDIGAVAGSAGVGGSTFAGHCSNGADGQRCGVDNDCFSHHCADITGSGFGGACVSGREGSPCSTDSNCEGGRVCVQKTGVNACVTPGYMSPCADSSDCSGLSCIDDLCQPQGSGQSCHYENLHRCRLWGCADLLCNVCPERAWSAAGLASFLIPGFGPACAVGCMGEVCRPLTPQINCTSDADCAEANLGSLSSYGPMRCTLLERNVVAPNTRVCKPYKPGALCAVGQTGGNCPVCYDGGIYDVSVISPNAGICTSGGPGEGCDREQQCTGGGRVNAKCTAYPGWVLSDGGCTREGTEGMPCGRFIGTNQTLDPVNTCDTGLLCPQTVLRCVQDPARICPH